MERLVLSGAQWERISGLIIGRPDQRGSTGRDSRMFVGGVLWIARTGSPWRDLPEVFGEWNSVFRRFSRWCHSATDLSVDRRRKPLKRLARVRSESGAVSHCGPKGPTQGKAPWAQRLDETEASRVGASAAEL
jgi:putative transposase